MRILHIGSGFRPWRRGGLVAYVEDLMDEQLRRGDEVEYFFSGRQYPLARGPRLRRWERSGGSMLEVVNSPLYDHGRQPALELSEPRLERMLERELAHFRPDAVHVHELAGLPSSLLDVVRKSGAPAIVTLQDYFLLCPAFRLIDSRGQICLRREIGADCMATTAADPRAPGLLIDATVTHEIRRSRLTRGLAERRKDWLRTAVGLLTGVGVARRRRAAAAPTAAAFQRRRDVNVERLKRADAVIAMSHRVEEIYRQLGVDSERMRTVQLTLAHIERLTPRRPRGGPLTFATLAGFGSETKGARVLLEAMRLLEDKARAGLFRLVVLGHVDERFANEGRGLPGLEVRGPYDPEQLDSMLDEVDVGIMPSVWEEAYGYAGVEFLAKGVPVIANAIGGMTEYVREGETGWLNRSCGAEELARIVAGLVERPERVAELSEQVLATRDSIVKPLATHADEMDAIYREAIAARRASTVVN